MLAALTLTPCLGRQSASIGCEHGRSSLTNMNSNQLEIYCGFLEEVAEPWMREHAAKKLEDATNPKNLRKQLEDAAAKAWRQYTDRFDAGLFREAAPYYAEYLAIKAGLSLHNDQGQAIRTGSVTPPTLKPQ